MLLCQGPRILTRNTSKTFTSSASPPDQPIRYGLGFDMDSPYSSLRGELFPIGSYGHTGFTGTSLWMDPGSGAYVIILASRLHPDGGGEMTPLRARVATIAAAALPDAPSAPRTPTPVLTTAAVPAPQPVGQVLAGVDVLARDRFAALQGR